MKTSSCDFEAAAGNGRAPRWGRRLLAVALVAAGYAGSQACIYLANRNMVPARILVMAPEPENGSAAAAIDPIIKTAIAALSSHGVLEAASTALGLSVKPGFADPEVEKTLAADLVIRQEAQAPVISIAVRNVAPETGVEIANYLSSFLTQDATPAPTAKAGTEGETFNRARAELAAFEHGEGSKGGKLQRQLLMDEQALQQTDAQLDAAQNLAAASARATLKSALAGQLVAGNVTPRLEALLGRYQEALANFGSASERLGPLHPELQARKIEIEKLSARITGELGTIAASAGRNAQRLSELQKAQASALAGTRAELKALGERRAALSKRLDDASSGPALAARTERKLPENARFRLISKAQAGPVDAATQLFYRAEGTLLGLLAGLVLLLRGRRMENEMTSSRGKAGADGVVAKDTPRGILEQIAMLEEMWPQTGRANAMPVAVNDDPAQSQLRPARQVVARMEHLRRQARDAANDPSSAALEQVLAEMQKLRAKVEWHAMMQERQRRTAEGRR